MATKAKTKTHVLVQPVPELTEQEQKAAKKLRLLSRKSNEELVRMHNNNVQLMDQLHEDQELIEQALDTRFPGKKQEEEIPTPAGVAKRKVENIWTVNADKVSEVAESFTKAQMAEIFEEKYKHKVPDSRMNDLVEYLGKKVKDYVVTITSYNVTRTAQNRAKHDEWFREKLSLAVNVVQKVRVTITPVKEGS